MLTICLLLILHFLRWRLKKSTTFIDQRELYHSLQEYCIQSSAYVQCHNQRPTLEKAKYFCPQSLTAGLLSSEETPELILDGKANQIVVTFVAVMTK